jgi:hypothetical protein
MQAAAAAEVAVRRKEMQAVAAAAATAAARRNEMHVVETSRLCSHVGCVKTKHDIGVCRDHGPRCSHDNGCEKNVYARGVCKRHHQLKIKQGGGRVNPNNGTGTLAPVIGHGIIRKDIPIMARLAKACHHPILRPLKLVMALRSKYVDATYYVKILRNPR